MTDVPLRETGDQAGAFVDRVGTFVDVYVFHNYRPQNQRRSFVVVVVVVVVVCMCVFVCVCVGGGVMRKRHNTTKNLYSYRVKYRGRTHR